MRWILCLAVVGHLVALYLPGSPEPGPELFPHVDKVVHVLLFAVPAHLVCLALPHRWWPVGLIALHAPLSEAIQASLLPYRSGDAWDIVADLAGVVLGLTAAWPFIRRAS